MVKIYRNESTTEGQAFWNGVQTAAKEAQDWPDWKKAGINVSVQHPSVRPSQEVGSTETDIASSQECNCGFDKLS